MAEVASAQLSIPRFEPMPLARLPEPFDHPDFIFEPKLDGFRALAHISAGQCKLVSRNRNAFKRFPALCTALGAAIEHDAVLDGEIVYVGEDGRPLFYDLMRRRSPQYFYAFDLLWIDGKDVRGLPLIERKKRLARIVRAPALLVQHIERRGIDLFDEVCARDMEGIVAKLGNAPYTPDATTWVKIKNRAYSQAEGRAEFFNSARGFQVAAQPVSPRSPYPQSSGQSSG